MKQNIKDGVYNIMDNKYYLQYRKGQLLSCEYLKYPNTYFRINRNDKNASNYFYFIEEIFTGYKLRYINNKKIKTSKKIDNNNIWNFIKLRNNKYIIINKNQCYIKINKFNIICENITIEEATQFNIIKIFEEIKTNDIEKKLKGHHSFLSPYHINNIANSVK